jgi:hypothetical protein
MAILKTNTGCSWMVELKDNKGTVCLDQGGLDLALLIR